jgi:DNA adenine methylase
MYKAPFSYFGGKSEIAAAVWSRLGDTPNYVEPFFGSGAVLLNRPHWRPDKSMLETVNDASGFIANFWRAVQSDPDAVTQYADRPVNENDLHAIHGWLVRQADGLAPRLEGDPDYYDPKIAGWWCWGAACWIGSGWCSGKGPWQQVETASGWQLVHLGDSGQGVNRKLVHLGDSGQGVNRKLVHLGDSGQGVNRKPTGSLSTWATVDGRVKGNRGFTPGFRRYLNVCPACASVAVTGHAFAAQRQRLRMA